MLNINKYIKGKTAIVGVGNILKGDDGVGSLLISRLREKTKADLFDCGEVPENYIRPIIDSKPETIIVVDASEWGGKIGELRIIKKKEINNFGFSTHNASLTLFFEYIKKELPSVNIIIVGIQTGKRKFMQQLNPQVLSTLNELVKYFAGL